MITSRVQSLFVYGTLMAPEVVQVLIDRVPIHEAATLQPHAHDRLHIYRRHPVKGFCFPGLIKKQRVVVEEDPDNDVHVQGILYRDLTESEIQILDYFEDTEYTKDDCQVKLQSCEVEQSEVYLWTSSVECLDLTQEWSYENFRSKNLESYLTTTVLPCRKRFDGLASNDANIT